MFVTIEGKQHTLRRAVDQDGDVLDILFQRRRDKRAAKRIFRWLLKGMSYSPRGIVTDKLSNHGAAKKELMPVVMHQHDKSQNNRAEVSHQPTWRQERQIRCFKSMRHAQRSLSAHGPINTLFAMGATL